VYNSHTHTSHIPEPLNQMYNETSSNRTPYIQLRQNVQFRGDSAFKRLILRISRFWTCIKGHVQNIGSVIEGVCYIGSVIEGVCYIGSVIEGVCYIGVSL